MAQLDVVGSSFAEPLIEHRWLLGKEGRCPLAGIEVEVANGCLRCDVVAGLIERQVCRVVDGPLEQAHGHLGSIGQLCGDLDRTLHELVILNGLVDQTELYRLVCIDNALAHEEIQSALDSEMLDEKPVATFVGLPAHAKGGAADPSGSPGNGEVAGQDQRKAELNGKAVDGDD